jgi:hypothetical protein
VRKEYLVNHIEAENVIANAVPVFEMDMYTAQVKDLEKWDKDFDFEISSDGKFFIFNIFSFENIVAMWNGFSAWFDTGFAKAPPRKYSFDGVRDLEDEDIILSTSPFVEYDFLKFY